MPTDETGLPSHWQPSSADPLEQVRELARWRVRRETIRLLTSPAPEGFANQEEASDYEITRGYAENEATMSRALVQHGLSGRPSPVLLAYARQHLGWGLEEGKQDESEQHPDAIAALELLHGLLDDYARSKAAGAGGADAVAAPGPAQPAAAAGE